MSAVIFSGSSVKALKPKLSLAGSAVLDATAISASTIIVTDANNNIISSGVAASALNSLTGTIAVNQIAFSTGAALTGSNQLEWTPGSNTFSVSGNTSNVGAVTFTLAQAASASLTDNATTQILSTPTASFNSLEITYSVTRGTNRRVGKAYVTQSGASADIAGPFSEIGSCGLSLTASVIAGNLGVSGTLTSTGTGATFSYIHTKWLG